jgi:hypothetical protein
MSANTNKKKDRNSEKRRLRDEVFARLFHQ